MTVAAHLLAGTSLVLALAACTGASCEALPGLRAERDAARASYAELTGSGTAKADESERADEEVHALDRQVYELEQSCG